LNKAALLQRWHDLCAELSIAHASLLAVSKYAPDEAVHCLIEAGQMDFAESRPQDLRDRALRFPSVRWHMIGPLQKNKAKYIARHAAMWHSLEDVETARAVAKQVVGRVLPVLVQVNVAGIEHQHGVMADTVAALVDEIASLPQLGFTGLMCMAPRGGDAKSVFSQLRSLRETLSGGSLEMPEAIRLCMGMSEDYRIAIAEGADMVRIGSGLFDAGRSTSFTERDESNE